MNTDSPSPRDESEAQITALLLGQLSPADAAAVRHAIESDPELQRLAERLRQTIGLVREATASPPELEPTPAEPLQLSADRRARLLAAFKTLRPEELTRRQHRRAQRRELLMVAALLIVLMLVAAPLLMPNQPKARAARIPSELKSRALMELAEGDRVEPATALPMAQVDAPSAPPTSFFKEKHSKDVAAGRADFSVESRQAVDALAFAVPAEPSPSPLRSKSLAIALPEIAQNSAAVGPSLYVAEMPAFSLGSKLAAPASGPEPAALAETRHHSERTVVGLARDLSTTTGVQRPPDAEKPAGAAAALRPRVEMSDTAFPEAQAGGALKYWSMQMPIGGAVAAGQREAGAVTAPARATEEKLAGRAVEFESVEAKRPSTTAQPAPAPAATPAPAIPPPPPAASEKLLGDLVAGGRVVYATTGLPVDETALAQKSDDYVLPGSDRRNDVAKAEIKSDAVNGVAELYAQFGNRAPQAGQSMAFGGVALAGTEVRTLDRLQTAPQRLSAPAADKGIGVGGRGGATSDRSNMRERFSRSASSAEDKKQQAEPELLAKAVKLRTEVLERGVDNEAPVRRLMTNAAPPQPEVTTADNAFSTFSLNVSDVSFKLAAASLEKGQMPDPAAVRAEEFINAFDYHDPEPAGDRPLAFRWERTRYPFAHNRDLVRFSVKTAASGRQPGRPLNVVLLLDNSGSMERADRVRIRQECLRVLAQQLRPEDRVSVVAFARTPRLWIDGLSGREASQLSERVGQLSPDGGTNLEEAMKLAYATARRHFQAGGINRVVLLTDGAANLGDVDPASLRRQVEDNRQRGVALDCFGLGWDGYNDELLEALSRNGDGRYGFINTPEAAATEFAGQLAGALHVAAADVKVQVEFNPRRVAAWRQMGYAKHQLTKEQFRDNTVDAAEIGAAEAGNALYVVEVNPAGDGPLGVARARFRIPGTSDYRELEWTLAYEGPARSLDQSSPTLRLSGVAAAFAEWLVASPFAADVTPASLQRYFQAVPGTFPADSRPKQLEIMLRQAAGLAGK